MLNADAPDLPLRAGSSKADASGVSRHRRTVDPSREFPTRAAWLTQTLGKRKLTAHAIEAMDGPSKHTVKRILDGRPVRDDALSRLASVFEIDPAAIPNG